MAITNNKENIMSTTKSQLLLQEALIKMGVEYASEHGLFFTDVEMNHNDGVDAMYDFYNQELVSLFTVSALGIDQGRGGYHVEVRVPEDPDERHWRIVRSGIIPIEECSSPAIDRFICNVIDEVTS